MEITPPEMSTLTKPLLKRETTNLPLRIEIDWVNWFDSRAPKLGLSRNAAILLAVKIGAPILDKFIALMEQHVVAQSRVIELAAAQITSSTTLAVPNDPPTAVSEGNERIKNGPASSPNGSTRPATVARGGKKGR